MMRCKLLFIFALVTMHIDGQNLLPNPGFEQNIDCPDSSGNLDLVKDWWSPWGKPVYFHACNNYQTNYRRIVPPGQKPYNEKPVIAYAGEGYAGIYMSVIWAPKYHDYLMCKLNKPLIKDSIYEVEMMVRLGNVWKYIDYIGAYFSVDKYEISKKQTLTFYSRYNDTYRYKTLNRVSLNFDKDTVRLYSNTSKLNDRNKWIQVKGEYTAKGGEQYITIGNFDIGNRGLYDNNIEPEEQTYIKDGLGNLEGDFNYSYYNNTFYYIDDVYVGKIPFNESRSYHQFASAVKVGQAIKLDNIFFDTGKASLQATSYSTLKLLLTYMKQNNDLFLTVAGHTDNTGNETNNQLLSENRAKAIVSYLQINGIDVSRMQFIGYGSSKPVTDNNTNKGRAQNRRVEFTLNQK
nr:OmpA family protein [uncultured Carboxylicivirga sp.]